MLNFLILFVVLLFEFIIVWGECLDLVFNFYGFLKGVCNIDKVEDIIRYVWSEVIFIWL